MPELKLGQRVELRKPHPCGSKTWTTVRLGADIGLQCEGCGRRVMLTQREFAKRSKRVLPSEPPQDPSATGEEHAT